MTLSGFKWKRKIMSVLLPFLSKCSSSPVALYVHLNMNQPPRLSSVHPIVRSFSGIAPGVAFVPF